LVNVQSRKIFWEISLLWKSRSRKTLPRTGARPPPQAELSGTSDHAEVDYADPPNPEW
jgi:hypothetical protein